MIISHEHKFIFIKTNKTAGTSVELALSRHCGPDDIITPIVEESLRRNGESRGAQNYEKTFLEFNLLNWAKFLLTGKRSWKYYNHVSASEILKYLDSDKWNSYFKFTIERNPWDRVISQYFYKNQTEPRPSIDEFLNSSDLQLLKDHGRKLYTIDGQIVVDKVCHFENLEADLQEVSRTIGIPKLELPMAKSSFRADSRSYSSLFTQAQAEKVADFFEDEIREQCYQF